MIKTPLFGCICFVMIATSGTAQVHSIIEPSANCLNKNDSLVVTIFLDATSSDALLVKYASMENQRPSKPTIDGPSRGKPETEYTFTASESSDPDGGSLQYMWDWGDGDFSDWLDTSEAVYIWSTEDKFDIRVKTQDEHGGESDWSDPLTFSTPKNKQLLDFYNIFWRLFQRFPVLEKILS